MKHAKKGITMILAIGFISSFGMMGCSSKPTQEELAQLDNVRAEISSLQQRKNALESEKATLNQSIATREATLTTCQNDITAVKAKLHE